MNGSWISRVLVVAVALLASEGRQVGPTAALAHAEARWQQQKPGTYEFSVEVRCFCPGLLLKPVPFRVTGDEVRPLADLEPYSRKIYEHFNTIEKLFETIRQSMKRGRHKIAAEYDPELGFPSSADLDPQATVADDELFFRVTNFRKIPGP